MELERVKKEALLTDDKIMELLRLEYGEEPKFTMNLKLLDVEDNMVYLPDALAYIAQAQADNFLNTNLGNITLKELIQMLNEKPHYTHLHPIRLTDKPKAYGHYLYEGACICGFRVQAYGKRLVENQLMGHFKTMERLKASCHKVELLKP